MCQFFVGAPLSPRSSQPLVGFRLNRCPEDEQLVAMIRRASGARTVYIFDCRPKFNAVANAAMSGGCARGFGREGGIILLPWFLLPSVFRNPLPLIHG